MVHVDHIHQLQNVPATRINAHCQMIACVRDRDARKANNVALVDRLLVLLRNKEIDLLSPAVEMLLQESDVIHYAVNVGLVNVAKDGNPHAIPT